MTIAEQIQLCRAILLEIQTGPGHPGGPIAIDGTPLQTVNDAVSVLVEEGLMTGSPPGTVYADAWASGRITLRGVEFISAYRDDVNVQEDLEQTAVRRGRSETALEIVSAVAKALSVFGPG